MITKQKFGVYTSWKKIKLKFNKYYKKEVIQAKFFIKKQYMSMFYFCVDYFVYLTIYNNFIAKCFCITSLQQTIYIF